MKTTFLTAIFVLLALCATATNGNSSSEVSQIALKYRQWILGSPDIDYSNPLIRTRYHEMIKMAHAADKNYNKDNNNDGYPDILFTENITIKKDKKQLSKLFSNFLFPFSLGYHLPPSKEHGLNNPYYQNETVKQRILEILDNLHNHGWKEGVDIGVLQMDKYPRTGYIGYYSGMSLRCLSYALSVFLNKDLLKEKALLERELATLIFISKEIGPEYDTPILWEQKGFNTDAIRSMFNVRWCYILALPENEANRSAEMAYFSKMLNKSLQIADGWADMIKPDFMGYHHQSAYLNAYAPHGYHAASIFVWHLNGTSYQVGQQAVDNLAQAILHSRIYCNMYDGPRSTAGRFPDNLNALIKNIPVFAYLSKIKSPYREELKGAFMRLWQTDYPDFQKDYLKDVECGISYTAALGEIELSTNLAGQGIKPEPHPNGFWYYPYGGLAIYRQDNWLISFSGCSKYIWDYESSKSGENQYGRFSRAGVLRIMAGGDPVSAQASGYVDEGWNWCNLPGATTAEMPFKDMKQKKYNNSHRQFTPESYLGGVQIDGNSALASVKYIAPVIYDTPLKKLNATKSFFFFDDFIVAVGSGIQAESDKNYPAQTTLFQNGMKDLNTSTTLNGKTLSNKFAKTISNKGAYLTDAQGHAYYVPESQQLVIERQKQSAPNDNNSKTGNGSFATARLLHGTNPDNTSYLYFIKINGGVDGAKDLAKNHDKYFNTVQQDQNAHIVSFLKEKATGYALLEANQTTQDKLLAKTDVPCLVMVKEREAQTISLAIQNPELGKIDMPCSYNEVHDHHTHAPSTIQPVQLTLYGEWQTLDSNEAVTIVSNKNNETVVRFNCFDGKMIQTNLKRTK